MAVNMTTQSIAVGDNWVRSSSGNYVGDDPLALAPSYGLLWPDGVEPVDSSLYPLQGSNRIWYVDLDAVTDGNGDEVAPFNNFTALFGSWDGANYTSGTAGLVGGDHVWVKGTASFADHIAGTFNLDIQIRRKSQLGSVSNPTVIRAWKGSSMSIDGNGGDARGIQTKVTDLTTGQALVLINLEYHNFEGTPIWNDDSMEYLEAISLNVHDITVDGASSGDANKGGITVSNRTSGISRIVRNGRFYDCNSANAGGAIVSNNNNSAIRLQGAQGLGGGSVSIYGNEIVRASSGIGEKHTGTCTVDIYENYISDVGYAYYNRQTGASDFYKNVVVNSDAAVIIVRETEAQARDLTVRKSTIIDTPLIITTSNNEINTSKVLVRDNIHSDPDEAGESYFLSFLSQGFDLTNFSASHNIYETNNNADFVSHEGVTYGFAAGKTQINDTSTIALGTDPLFVDRASGDYRLGAGSPALNAASDGTNIGAF